MCASFSDHSLHSRGSFEGFRRISSPQKWLYTHRAPKWSTYHSRPAQEIQAKFFDHFPRGDVTGMPDVPPVRIEVRESRRTVAAVHTATYWPPQQVQLLVLHLDATDRQLHRRNPSDGASIDPPQSGVQFRWRFETDTDVIGPMRLSVPISTEQVDLTLFAGIRKMHQGREVVFECSYGFTEDIVTRGWLRASHRGIDHTRSATWEAFHPHATEQPVPPGEIVDLDLTLLPSATRFAAGDELVLHLRDRWFFLANQITGRFPATYTHTRPQRWTIHTGGDHQASLTIPIWT